MMSEAEPALLTELCATLMGQNNSTTDADRNISRNARKNAAATTTKTATARSNRATTGASAAGSRRRIAARPPPASTAASVTARRSAAVPAPVGPLAPRSVNTSRRGLSSSGIPCSGSSAGVGLRASNSKARRADDDDTDSNSVGGHVSTRPGAGRVGGGGGDGGSESPARKSTRKVSPKKSVEERRRGGGSPKEMALSEDQQRAVDLVVEGRSVFFTGGCVGLCVGGCGLEGWKERERYDSEGEGESVSCFFLADESIGEVMIDVVVGKGGRGPQRQQYHRIEQVLRACMAHRNGIHSRLHGPQRNSCCASPLRILCRS